MTDKEKAKAYDEAIEKSKEFYTQCKKVGAKETVDFLENIFPELKESEDERIRKCVKYAIDKLFLKEKIVCDVHKDDVLSWLEKQGKKTNPYNGMSFEYNGYIWGMCARDNGIDISLDKQLPKHPENQSTKDYATVESIPVMDESCVALTTNICEQKSVWSEEDKALLQDAIHWIDEFQRSNRCKNENDMQNSVTCQRWLESLKEKLKGE